VVFIVHTFSETISRVDASRVRWIFCFGMANSMVNPLIYGAFHLRMRRIGAGRRSVLTILCRLCHSTSKSSKVALWVGVVGSLVLELPGGPRGGRSPPSSPVHVSRHSFLSEDRF